MSMHVWACVCTRRWYQFRRSFWDTISGTCHGCPGCMPGKFPAEVVGEWGEL